MAEEEQKTENTIVPVDTYLKSGIHIGTKFKTKYMSKFIYKSRPDGLYILDLQKIDERIREAIKFLIQYEPEEILVVGRRENAWKPLKMFSKVTGIKVLIGRYQPGMMTNKNLRTFFEPKLLFAVDPWPDRNAVMDSLRAGVPVIGVCDTNNQTNNLDFVIPSNNKGKKSLGLLFWILAKEYSLKKGLIQKESDFKYSIDDFTEE